MDLVSKPNCKSNVWRYFGFRANDKGSPQDPNNPICRLCRKIVQTKSGSTTNLRVHLKNRHRKSLPSSAVTIPLEPHDSTLLDFGPEDPPALPPTPNQNYISDAALPLGEPWLQGGPSQAMLSLPFCLNLWWEPESSGASSPGSSSKDWVGEMRVYAKHGLQEGLIFGPFVGEVVRGQLQSSLSHAWVVRDDCDFYYINASDDNKSNWMRYVTYASSEEEHNLIVFQLHRQIYYKTSKPIIEGAELKVRIGKDYAAILGLGMDHGEDMRYDVGKKEAVLRLFQDIQLVTLQEPSSSSRWSDSGQSQDPKLLISKVTSISTPDSAVDSGPASAPSPTSNASLQTFGPQQDYDFFPGTENLLSHPSVGKNRLWYFYGFKPDPLGPPPDWSLAVCKLCGDTVASGDTMNHLMGKHEIRPNHIRRFPRARSTMVSGQTSKTPIPSSSVEMSSTFPLVPLAPDGLTNAIGNFMIRDLHQPAMAEGEGFRQLMHTLLPSYLELPTACMLEDLLKDLHTRGKKSLGQLLRRKTVSGDEENVFDNESPIKVDSGRCGRPSLFHKEVPHFVTLSLDVWYHVWQGDTNKYATLWAHYIDANFNSQNWALTTQRLLETETGDVEARVKTMASEWGIALPHLVLLGGDKHGKKSSGSRRSNKSGEPAGSDPKSTTFPKRTDSVSSKEVKSIETSDAFSEAVPYIPCFIGAVQGCIEEAMVHPVISKTLSMFQHFLSGLFTVCPKNNPHQPQIDNLLLQIPVQELAQLKSWAHSQPSWKSIFTVINALIKHQNLVFDLIKIQTDCSIKREGSGETDSNVGSLMVPSESEWKVLQELCLVLKPLDVACQTLAKEAFPRVSLIKPFLIGLLTRHFVPQPKDSSPIMKGVKMRMRQNLAACYDNPVVNRVLCVACSLDPQFRHLGFMDAKEQTATLDWLKNEAIRMVKEEKTSRRQKLDGERRGQIKRSPYHSSSDSDDTHRRRSKRLKDTLPINFKELDDTEVEDSNTEEADESETAGQGGLSGMQFLLGDLFGSPKRKKSSVEEGVEEELSLFRADKRPLLGVEPLEWWKTKMGQFPLLATVARAYLAAPAVAGTAAQDFLIEGGLAMNTKRMTIPPESLAEMLFLHYNHMTATDCQGNVHLPRVCL